jgi:hypothetical protein
MDIYLPKGLYSYLTLKDICDGHVIIVFNFVYQIDMYLKYM